MLINRQNRVRVPIGSLRKFLKDVCEMLHVLPESVTVCLVTNPMIARWNSQYRGKLVPTDVLSFPAAGPMRQRFQRNGNSPARWTSARASCAWGNAFHTDGGYLGDLAIAPAMARKNAQRLGRTFDNEIRILILHGVLHLLGYDHETDQGQMERRERLLRQRLGLN